MNNNFMTPSVYTFENFSKNVGNCKTNLFNVCKFTADKTISVKDPSITQEMANDKIVEKFQQILGVSPNEPISLRTLESKKPEMRAIFEVIERVIDTRVDQFLYASDFFKKFVETQSITVGTELSFRIKNQKGISFAEHSGNSWSMNRQRLNGDATIVVPLKYYSAQVYEEFLRLMAKRIDFADLIESVEESIKLFLLERITNVFDKGLDAVPPMFKHTGQLDAKELLKLANLVRTANGGSKVYIAGTRTALSLLPNIMNAGNLGLISESMKDQINNTGLLPKWSGFDIVEIPEVYLPEQTTNIIADDKLWVLSADDKFIKCAKGETITKLTTPFDSNDMSINYSIIMSLGFACVLNSYNAVYKITQ